MGKRFNGRKMSHCKVAKTRIKKEERQKKNLPGTGKKK